MAKFLLVYHGGKMAETPEAQAKAMEAWGAWFGQLGPAVTGYDAIGKAKGCPLLADGGSVEVCETINVM